MDKWKIMGVVRGGKFTPWVREQIVAFLDGVPEGMPILVTFEQGKKTRSDKQNRYYWGVVIAMLHQMVKATGQNISQEELHEYLKRKVGNLERIIYLPDGETAVITGSTAKLGTTEFSDYVEAIRAWALERFGINIPSPGDLFTDENGETVKNIHSDVENNG